MMLETFLLAAGAPVSTAPTIPFRVIRDLGTPAVEEARANRSKVKTRPEIVGYGDTTESKRENERLNDLGQTGEISIEGVLGEDGHFTPYSLRNTTRSIELDNYNIASAERVRFKPALDLDGKPVSIWMAYASGGPGTHLLRDKCRRFIAGIEWWETAWPEKTIKNFPPYLLVRGLGIMQNLKQGKGNEPPKYSGDAMWDGLISYCRSNPDKTVPFLAGKRVER
jgi:hypothetical protein